MTDMDAQPEKDSSIIILNFRSKSRDNELSKAELNVLNTFVVKSNVIEIGPWVDSNQQ